jgi:hypothetical protein
MLSPTLAFLCMGFPFAQDAAPAVPAPAVAATEYPWEALIVWLQLQRERFAADLDLAHAALTARAESHAPELLERLAPRPPAVVHSGYGRLPELLADTPAGKPPEPRETIYSLERLSTGFAPEYRDAALLATRAKDPNRDLAALVTEFERLRTRLRDLEEHIAYHAQWQREMVASRAYFEQRNRLVATAREIQAARAKGGPEAAAAAERQRALRDALAPLQRTPGVHLERRADGELVLPVTIWTDVTDAAFLAAFRESVAEAYTRSEAALASHLSIEITWHPVSATELYAGAPPEPGSAIDTVAHIARFPPDVLVLTTGGNSMHSWVSRAIVLGPAPIVRHSLAHEFGHLLGFSDVYLRGFDGSVDAPFGALIVEWTGLADDLMGSPTVGRVTSEMIAKLVETYGGE